MSETSLEVDRLVARKIELADATGRVAITLSAMPNVAGVWVGEYPNCVAICCKDGKPYISIYDENSTHPGDGLPPFALCVDDGVPSLQYRDNDGEIQIAPLAVIMPKTIA